MKSKRPTKTITIHLCALAMLFLAVGSSNAQSSNAKAAPTPDANPVVNNVIPEAPEVDGWEREGKHVFSPASLGYSYNYNSPKAGRVTLYVYDGGYAAISDGLKGVVKSELEKAKLEVRTYAKEGHYQNVKMKGDKTVKLGGRLGKVKSLHVRMQFLKDGVASDSEIYLFAYKNHFIKIRATRPSANKEDAKPLMAAILSAIDSTFASN